LAIGTREAERARTKVLARTIARASAPIQTRTWSTRIGCCLAIGPEEAGRTRAKVLVQNVGEALAPILARTG